MQQPYAARRRTASAGRRGENRARQLHSPAGRCNASPTGSSGVPPPGACDARHGDSDVRPERLSRAQGHRRGGTVRPECGPVRRGPVLAHPELSVLGLVGRTQRLRRRTRRSSRTPKVRRAATSPPVHDSAAPSVRQQPRAMSSTSSSTGRVVLGRRSLAPNAPRKLFRRLLALSRESSTQIPQACAQMVRLAHPRLSPGLDEYTRVAREAHR